MAPAIRDGDRVTVVPVRPQEIRRGDVVLYTSDRGLTAHRVAGRPDGGRENFLAQGDAPGSPWETVAVRQLLGRVEAVERDGRRVSIRRPFVRQVARIAWLAGRFLTRLRTKSAEITPKSVEGLPGGRRILGLSGWGWAATHCPTETSAPGKDREQRLQAQERE